MKLVSLQDENKEIGVGDLVVSGGITCRVNSVTLPEDDKPGEIYCHELQGGTTHVLTAEQAGGKWVGSPAQRFEHDGDTKGQASHPVQPTPPDGSASGATPEERSNEGSKSGDPALEATLDAKAHEEAAAAKKEEAKRASAKK
jgi:hypothetical protein